MTKDSFQKFLFLPRANYKPRKPNIATSREQCLRAIQWLIQQRPEGSVHYDLETVGLQYEDESRPVTTAGISCAEFCIGINLVELTIEEQEPIWEWLKKQKLGGFNLAFDVAWPWGPDLRELTLSSDTAVLFRSLATDAGKGTRLNLETLIEDVLGWPDHQKDWLKEKLQEHELSKNDMWKLSFLEPEGYTFYCAMDAEASLQAELYFMDVIAARDFNHRKWIPIWNDKIKRIVRGQYEGIPIDRDKCLRNIIWTNARLLWLENQIANHPEVSGYIKQWQAEELAKTYILKVDEKRIWAGKEDEPWLYPERWSFALAASPEAAAKLPAWLKEYGGKFYRTEPKFGMKGAKNPMPRFNFRSVDSMMWLIYDCLLRGKYNIVYTHDEKKGQKPRGYVEFERNGRNYEVDLTQPGGSKPTGGDVLKPFGEIGQLIDEFKELLKLSEEFLWKVYNASERTGRMHTSVMVFGTATSRSAGGSSKKSDKAGKGKKKGSDKLDGSQLTDFLEKVATARGAGDSDVGGGVSGGAEEGEQGTGD